MSLIKWLLLLFIGLKLAGQIDWSWWLVLIPLYIDFSLHVLRAGGGNK